MYLLDTVFSLEPDGVVLLVPEVLAVLEWPHSVTTEPCDEVSHPHKPGLVGVRRLKELLELFRV